jgi:glycosyltransferase involved in cell wall biosynthesis
MPCLNRAHIIRQAIDSILGQTYKNIELIVVDGLSSDNTVEILRGYGDKIRWLSEKDKNTSEAMNKGLDMASGDFITFLNSDDYFKDDKVIENAVADLTSDGQADILCADLEITPENSNVVLYRVPSNPKKMVWALSIHLPGSFFRRTLFANRRFDLSFSTANDYEMILYFVRVLKAKVIYVPRVNVIFRLGGLCNDVRRAFLISYECYRIRSKYYGQAIAIPFYVVAYTVSILRTSGFRPQLWLRQTRAWIHASK